MATTYKEKIDEKKKFVIVCIPAYNEEKTIAKLIIDSRKYSDKIIVVDDGSTDYTFKIARELGADVIRHEKNLGKGSALRTCFTHSMTFAPDIVVTIDGDGQHDPLFIPKLIAPIINENVDVVIGSRSKKTKMPKIRKMGLKTINYLNKKAVQSEITDAQSGFRAYSIKSINCIAQQRYNDYSAEFEMLNTLVKNGFEITEIPIEIKYDGLEKTSKRNFLTHGGELILASLFLIISRRPIIYLALPGTLLLTAGLIFGFITLFLFNADRYFSIPNAVLSGILVILGTLFILSSMFIYILAKMPNR